jgi:hypothetical protein
VAIRENIAAWEPYIPQAAGGRPITQDALNDANEAIAKGAPRSQVLQRLKERGYDLGSIKGGQ